MVKYFTVLFIIVLFTGCKDVTSLQPEDQALSKTAQSQYQEYGVIDANYVVQGTDINIRINVNGILSHSYDYMVIIKYSYGTKMVSIPKPTDNYFQLPYYGSEDIQDVTLMAIIIHS